MKYVVLLRGVNVGGNSKVSMADLKAALKKDGFNEVQTYINSGNVILTSPLPTSKVNDAVGEVIEKTFGFKVDAITLTKTAFRKIADALPDNWTHGKSMGCNVLFLWQDIDSPDVIERLPAKPGIDTVKYVPGAVLWAFDGSNVNRTGIAKLTDPGLTQKMTIRNCNTVRKIVALFDA
ncbi:DUF1697 domain-containing protein [Actinocrispum wychmicini]|uniref:Uncharacterized protein (DUF1697 family) n=1 Tax=Actinocrispum wychmicini TaxID=1213861 RepID=A0A4R2IND1_9PSEU|nr:DUF1697 domain-containing protein [Actinocrispum wychmicini]TCO45846.1 uncharacterized protein (DUF1697 family) [Actinocrispum wychmicini]